jgi:hypothetical protein
MKYPIFFAKWLLFVMGAAIFLNFGPLYAERIEDFDMDTCVGESKLIVQGSLNPDGVVEVSRVLKGDPGSSPKLQLDLGKFQFEALQKQMVHLGPMEVVVFLTVKAGDQWRETMQYAGLVAFENDAVFLMEDGPMTSQLAKSPVYTKDTFLRGLSDALQASKERDGLVAMPRSVERTKHLIGFTLQHCHPLMDGERPPFQNYHLRQIAAGLTNPTAQEQGVIVQALQDTNTSHDRIILLNLSGLIPLKDGALDSIAVYLPRTNPP